MLISTHCTNERNDETHSVGGSSNNVNDGNGVEERLAGNDISKGIVIVMCRGSALVKLTSA